MSTGQVFFGAPFYISFTHPGTELNLGIDISLSLFEWIFISPKDKSIALNGSFNVVIHTSLRSESSKYKLGHFDNLPEGCSDIEYLLVVYHTLQFYHGKQYCLPTCWRWFHLSPGIAYLSGEQISLHWFENRLWRWLSLSKRMTPNIKILNTTQPVTPPFAAHKWAASDHQCSRPPWQGSGTFSRSGKVTQLIIVGWSGSEFQTGNSSIKLQKWSCEVWS